MIAKQVDPKGLNTSPMRSRLKKTEASLLADIKATTFAAKASAKLQSPDIHAIPSPASTVSFAPCGAQSPGEELSFPPIPDDAQMGSPFLCPYCLTFLQLKRDDLEHQCRLVAFTSRIGSALLICLGSMHIFPLRVRQLFVTSCLVRARTNSTPYSMAMLTMPYHIQSFG